MVRFTIRDVLWLTALVAMGVGWSLDHWQPVTTTRIKAMLRRGGAAVSKDGGGKINSYMTKEGIIVTVWEFSDDDNLYPPRF